MIKAIAIIVSAFLISGCNLINSSEKKFDCEKAFDLSGQEFPSDWWNGKESISDWWELKQTRFSKGDTITASLTNKSDDDIFRVRASCGRTFLEKKINHEWKSLKHHLDFACPTAVFYYEFEAGEIINLNFRYEILAKMVEKTKPDEDTEGLYRFSETITNNKRYVESDILKIHSEIFCIEG